MRLSISRKTVVTTFLIGMAVAGLHAQDTMITQDGDVKAVFVVDIGNTAVFYKTENTDAASIQSISKEQIFLIKRPTARNMTSATLQFLPRRRAHPRKL